MLIVTHPGQAHRDDLMACALIAAFAMNVEGINVDDIRVERRDPTPEEINDPNVWVVDVGKVHDPSKRNFDHHQDRQMPAAVRLVMDYLAEQNEEWAKIHDGLAMNAWWRLTSHMDTMGPFQTGKSYGFDPGLITAGGALRSPIEDAFLATFKVAPTETTKALATAMKALLDEMKALADEMSEVGKVIEFRYVNGFPVLIQHKRCSDLVTAKLCEEHADHGGGDIAVVISPDDRGPGWACLRWQDHPSVDFAPLSGRDDVIFAHPTGFMLKTAEMSLDDALTLVAKGVSRALALWREELK